MPFLHLRTAAPLTPALRQSLAEGATAAFHTLLGKRREVTAILIEQIEPAGWFIDGQPVAAATPAVEGEAFITAGTNSAEEKAAFLAALDALLRAQLGPLPLASYLIIHDLPGSDWGYSGQTQAARALARQAASPASNPLVKQP